MNSIQVLEIKLTNRKVVNRDQTNSIRYMSTSLLYPFDSAKLTILVLW